MIGNAVICTNCNVPGEYQPEAMDTSKEFKCPMCGTTDWNIVVTDLYTNEFINACNNNLKFYKFIMGEE